MMALGGIMGLLGAGGAAAGTAAAGTATAAVGTGLSISSILQGVATVGGIVASLAASSAQADQYAAAAQDARAERAPEIIQSVDRKRSLLASAQEAVSSSDVAYAASGVDLSFGSARQARINAYRAAELGHATDTAMTSSRLDRLDQRARAYDSMAKRAKMLGLFDAGMRGVGLIDSLMARG